MTPGQDPQLPQQDLDREFSPSTLVDSLDHYLDDYALLSNNVRRDHAVQTDLRYGDGDEETLDFFPGTPGGPVLVFLHGGNWQALTKDSSAFPARKLLDAGIGFAAVNYGLAPAFGLGEIVEMVRRCLRWLHQNANHLGFDPDRIHVSGTSAGAHLAVTSLLPEPDALPGSEPAHTVAGLTLLSGIYDLEPVRRSYINEALALDRLTAQRYSPVRNLPDVLPPVVLARGDNETGECARQQALMAKELASRTRLTELVVSGRNHFDLPYDLGARNTALGAAVLAQIEGGQERTERGEPA